MTDTNDIQIAEDICAPTLARRVAALLGRDPATIVEGDPLPRGWHVALFTASTPQGDLRHDGVGGLGFTLPPSDLPRMVMGGRRTRFIGDIPVGARVRRESRIGSVTEKEGRAGRMCLMTVVHTVLVDGAAAPVLVEEQDYIMLGEAPPQAPAPTPAGTSAGTENGAGTAAPKVKERAAEHSGPQPTERRAVCFDETMLFRYSAITFNAHRIHYDKDYAREREGYPGLLVNGGLSTLFLFEMFKSLELGAPASFATRNVAPLYCRQAATMCLAPGDGDGAYTMWIEGEQGQRFLSGEARVGG